MLNPIRTAAVLGAGVMGAQIAAHLANAGLSVLLLDLPAPSSDKNALVTAAFEKAKKLSPPIFFTEQVARRVQLGNYDDDLQKLDHMDWIIEAVVEDLAVKQQLLARVDALFLKENVILSTNTSGLPVQSIAAGHTAHFRRRFIGTHFFNPPRYQHLLELIPIPETDPDVLERLQAFGRPHLGKGVVIAKDTPNFIGNRIGLFVTLLGLWAWEQAGYSIAEIDTLTGPLVGRPKSATFRTADLVGLDTLAAVTHHLYQAVPEDEQRDLFRVPPRLQKLVAAGQLGAKTGAGFYTKRQGEILALNPATFTYEAAQPLNLEGLQALSRIPDLGDRLRQLYQDPGRSGAFTRRMLLALFSYSACRLPEIADSPADIDRALRWGFGWEAGPFELWDMLGFQTILTDMQEANLPIPEWVQQMAGQGVTQFYDDVGGIYGPPLGYELLPIDPDDDIDLAALGQEPQRVLWQNAEAALLDLEDGVALYEFRSKGNTLSQRVVAGLAEVLNLLDHNDDLKGLVIGNSSAHFSAGANLAEMGTLAQTENGAGIAALIDEFQALLKRIHYFPKPIVAAIQGRVLGGGCELVMACPQVVAAAETYIGLVELSVGLIPGAGGIMRMMARVSERSASPLPSHVHPFLKTAFETIATAKVSSSAQEAIQLGYLPPTARIVMQGDRRLAVAKAEVLHLDRVGYRPSPELNAILVLGRPARAMLEHTAYLYQQAGFASEYDRFLANRLVYVMTGGDLSGPAWVHEDYLLRLEREMFLPLLREPKTQARMAHLLKTKKPLRN